MCPDVYRNQYFNFVSLFLPRCLKAPCELCISCQQKKTCIFKTCAKMETLNRLQPNRSSESVPESSLSAAERRTPPLPRRLKRTLGPSATTTSPLPTSKCSVCTLLIPRSIFDLHRDIHCAAFGVDSIEKIGKTFFYFPKLN